MDNINTFFGARFFIINRGLMGKKARPRVFTRWFADGWNPENKLVILQLSPCHFVIDYYKFYPKCRFLLDFKTAQCPMVNLELNINNNFQARELHRRFYMENNIQHSWSDMNSSYKDPDPEGHSQSLLPEMFTKPVEVVVMNLTSNQKNLEERVDMINGSSKISLMSKKSDLSRPLVYCYKIYVPFTLNKFDFYKYIVFGLVEVYDPIRDYFNIILFRKLLIGKLPGGRQFKTTIKHIIPTS